MSIPSNLDDIAPEGYELPPAPPSPAESQELHFGPRAVEISPQSSVVSNVRRKSIEVLHLGPAAAPASPSVSEPPSAPLSYQRHVSATGAPTSITIQDVTKAVLSGISLQEKLVQVASSRIPPPVLSAVDTAIKRLTNTINSGGDLNSLFTELQKSSPDVLKDPSVQTAIRKGMTDAFVNEKHEMLPVLYAQIIKKEKDAAAAEFAKRFLENFVERGGSHQKLTEFFRCMDALNPEVLKQGDVQRTIRKEMLLAFQDQKYPTASVLYERTINKPAYVGKEESAGDFSTLHAVKGHLTNILERNGQLEEFLNYYKPISPTTVSRPLDDPSVQAMMREGMSEAFARGTHWMLPVLYEQIIDKDAVEVSFLENYIDKLGDTNDSRSLEAVFQCMHALNPRVLQNVDVQAMIKEKMLNDFAGQKYSIALFLSEKVPPAVLQHPDVQSVIRQGMLHAFLSQNYSRASFLYEKITDKREAASILSSSLQALSAVAATGNDSVTYLAESLSAELKACGIIPVMQFLGLNPQAKKVVSDAIPGKIENVFQMLQKLCDLRTHLQDGEVEKAFQVLLDIPERSLDDEFRIIHEFLNDSPELLEKKDKFGKTIVYYSLDSTKYPADPKYTMTPEHRMKYFVTNMPTAVELQKQEALERKTLQEKELREINEQDKLGKNAFMHACEHGNNEKAKELFDKVVSAGRFCRGKDNVGKPVFCTSDNKGKSVFQYAKEAGLEDVIVEGIKKLPQDQALELIEQFPEIKGHPEVKAYIQKMVNSILKVLENQPTPIARDREIQHMSPQYLAWLFEALPSVVGQSQEPRKNILEGILQSVRQIVAPQDKVEVPPAKDIVTFATGKHPFIDVVSRISGCKVRDKNYKGLMGAVAKDFMAMQQGYYSQLRKEDVVPGQESDKIIKWAQFSEKATKYISSLLESCFEVDPTPLLMHFFIDVSEQCMSSGDFATATIIHNALRDSLGRTPLMQSILPKMQSKWDSLQTVMSPVNNYAAMQKKIQEVKRHQGGAIIPFVNLLRILPMTPVGVPPKQLLTSLYTDIALNDSADKAQLQHANALRRGIKERIHRIQSGKEPDLAAGLLKVVNEDFEKLKKLITDHQELQYLLEKKLEDEVQAINLPAK